MSLVPSRGGDRRTLNSVGPRRQDGDRVVHTLVGKRTGAVLEPSLRLEGRHFHRVHCEGAALFIPHRANAHHARLTLAPDVWQWDWYILTPSSSPWTTISFRADFGSPRLAQVFMEGRARTPLQLIVNDETTGVLPARAST